jgi:ribosomal protein S25
MRQTDYMTEQRLREIETLALSMLLQSGSISPYSLAERAKTTSFIARDILRGLARKGHVTALSSGRFGRPSQLTGRPTGQSK